LFRNPGGSTTPFFQTSAGKALIAEARADPSTQSCLATPLTCLGAASAAAFGPRADPAANAGRRKAVVIG